MVVLKAKMAFLVPLSAINQNWVLDILSKILFRILYINTRSITLFRWLMRLIVRCWFWIFSGNISYLLMHGFDVYSVVALYFFTLGVDLIFPCFITPLLDCLTLRISVHSQILCFIVYHFSSALVICFSSLNSFLTLMLHLLFISSLSSILIWSLGVVFALFSCFSLSGMVPTIGAWSLPRSAPGIALHDVNGFRNRSSIKIKSIWFRVLSPGLSQVQHLLGWWFSNQVFITVRFCSLHHSMRCSLLSFFFPIPNGSTIIPDLSFPTFEIKSPFVTLTSRDFSSHKWDNIYSAFKL